ncbi:MAG: hypothetical protein FJ294_06930 [Planctomycetes bacterium]|nr:hypothetical protein [Planctomycetota bacterium]
MKLLTNQRPTANRGLRALALSMVMALVALSFFTHADSLMGPSGTGGDTVGSLPMMAPPPSSGIDAGAVTPSNSIGPDRPAFALVGLESEVLAAIVDAYPTGPDGCFERVVLPNGRVRYLFLGHVDVLLDRAFMSTGRVRAQTVVGLPFVGGVATISVANIPRASEPLALGPKELKIQQLDAAGVLDQVFRWHALSLQSQHRVIYIKAVGTILRVEQRD